MPRLEAEDLKMAEKRSKVTQELEFTDAICALFVTVLDLNEMVGMFEATRGR